MGRRFAAVGGLRRAIRDSRSFGRNPARPPLPTTAIEYWHSEFGASAANAIGQIGGRVLPAVGTPTLASDGAFFNGKPVYKTSAPGSYWHGTGLTPLFVAGQRPWFFCIGRVHSYISGQIASLWGIGSQQGIAGAYGFRHGGRGIAPNGYWEALRTNNGSFLSADSPLASGDTNPHTFELIGASPTVGLVSIVGGIVQGTLTTSSTQSGIGGTIDQAAIGLSSFTGAASVAFLLACAPEPSASEKAALNAWSLGYWGVS